MTRPSTAYQPITYGESTRGRAGSPARKDHQERRESLSRTCENADGQDKCNEAVHEMNLCIRVGIYV